MTSYASISQDKFNGLVDAYIPAATWCRLFNETQMERREPHEQHAKLCALWRGVSKELEQVDAKIKELDKSSSSSAAVEVLEGRRASLLCLRALAQYKLRVIDRELAQLGLIRFSRFTGKVATISLELQKQCKTEFAAAVRQIYPEYEDSTVKFATKDLMDYSSKERIPDRLARGLRSPYDYRPTPDVLNKRIYHVVANLLAQSDKCHPMIVELKDCLDNNMSLSGDQLLAKLSAIASKHSESSCKKHPWAGKLRKAILAKDILELDYLKARVELEPGFVEDRKARAEQKPIWSDALRVRLVGEHKLASKEHAQFSSFIELYVAAELAERVALLALVPLQEPLAELETWDSSITSSEQSMKRWDEQKAVLLEKLKEGHLRALKSIDRRTRFDSARKYNSLVQDLEPQMAHALALLQQSEGTWDAFFARCAELFKDKKEQPWEQKVYRNYMFSKTSCSVPDNIVETVFQNLNQRNLQ